MARKITNNTARSYTGPKHTCTGPDGKPFVVQLRIRPGQSVDVPEEYVERLMQERGWRARLGADGVIRRPAARSNGAADLFEKTVQTRRKAIQERERREQGDLEQRLAALESNTRDADARAKAAEAKAAELEAKTAELEAELAKARTAKPDDKPKDPPAKK